MHSSAVSPPMDTSQWPKCPACGLPNIPERTLCKRCRAPLTGPVPQPPVATDVTGRLYTSADAQHHVFVRASCLEYAGPAITICTAWGNIQALQAEGAQVYLWLGRPATVRQIRSCDHLLDAWHAHTIPLHCFGYPSNRALLADLQRFAPQLWPARRPQPWR